MNLATFLAARHSLCVNQLDHLGVVTPKECLIDWSAGRDDDLFACLGPKGKTLPSFDPGYRVLASRLILSISSLLPSVNGTAL